MSKDTRDSGTDGGRRIDRSEMGLAPSQQVKQSEQYSSLKWKRKNMLKEP